MIFWKKFEFKRSTISISIIMQFWTKFQHALTFMSAIFSTIPSGASSAPICFEEEKRAKKLLALPIRITTIGTTIWEILPWIESWKGYSGQVLTVLCPYSEMESLRTYFSSKLLLLLYFNCRIVESTSVYFPIYRYIHPTFLRVVAMKIP